VSFGAPYLLFGLLAVPLAALGYRLLERRRVRRSAAWSRQAMLPNIVRRPERRLGSLPVALFLLGLTFLLVGFARPQRVVAASAGGAPTIVLAFDTSGSMAATDVQPSRLRVARNAAIRLLDQLPPQYRVAVVTFADKVRLIVPPTLDRKGLIAQLPARITPLGGTSIGDGIRRSLAVIIAAADQTDSGGLYRPGAAVLFSDGAQTGGGTTLDAAAVSALVDYIPVDAIAVGTPKGVVTQSFEVSGVRTSAQIAVPAQTAPLRRLARQTGGTLFDAASLAQSPAQLSRVWENLRSSGAQGDTTRELSAASAGVALLLVLAGVVVSGLWFGRVA
jgi:Ca-activated chloride channel family protein